MSEERGVMEESGKKGCRRGKEGVNEREVGKRVEKRERRERGKGEEKKVWETEGRDAGEIRNVVKRRKECRRLKW